MFLKFEFQNRRSRNVEVVGFEIFLLGSPSQKILGLTQQLVAAEQAVIVVYYTNRAKSCNIEVK